MDLPDDPSYPFKLVISFRLSNILAEAFRGIFGTSEEIVFRGMNKEVLDEVIYLLCYRAHPHLRYFIITGPDGPVEWFSNDN